MKNALVQTQRTHRVALQCEMKTVLLVLFALTFCMPITGADKKELQQLDVEAKKFFESFSKALEKQDAAEAAMHIAPKYRERFSKGYRFWRFIIKITLALFWGELW